MATRYTTILDQDVEQATLSCVPYNDTQAVNVLYNTVRNFVRGCMIWLALLIDESDATNILWITIKNAQSVVYRALLPSRAYEDHCIFIFLNGAIYHVLKTVEYFSGPLRRTRHAL